MNITPDWLTAVGIILAVFVALLVAFLSTIQARIAKPKLKIEFENNEPYCRHARILNEPVGDMIEKAKTSQGYTNIQPPEGYFFRLRIRNKGKSTAREVEIKLVRMLDADSKKEVSDYDPTHLVWVGYGTNNSISISRGLYEYANICFVKHRSTV